MNNPNKNDTLKTEFLEKMKRLALEIETMRLKRLQGEYVAMSILIKKKKEFKKLQDEYKKRFSTLGKTT